MREDEQQIEAEKGGDMKTYSMHIVACTIFLCMAACTVQAATWAPVEKECPVCHTRSTYYEIASAGPYIYEYPSKYEYIFWPYIDARVVYTCKQCWYSCFPWDFRELPQGTYAAVRDVLDSIALYPTNGDYTVIPMSYRMNVAERIYRLFSKDDEFWCHFYRVKAYHLTAEEKLAKADQARTQALQLAVKMLGAPENAGMYKELYLIAGAMKFFLRDYEGADEYFKRARRVVFEKQGMDRVDQVDVDSYLSALLDAYLEKIKTLEIPRIVFSRTPAIASLKGSPKLFEDSSIVVTGMLINQGSGYFKDFHPALQDSLGNVIPVQSWAPLEIPPPVNPDLEQPRVMSYFLGHDIEAQGFFRRDKNSRFGGTYYLEVRSAKTIP